MALNFYRIAGRHIVACLLLSCLSHLAWGDTATQAHPTLASPELSLPELTRWRNQLTQTRLLAENDALLAYKNAQRLQSAIPEEAEPVDRIRIFNLLGRIEMYLALTEESVKHTQQALTLAARYNDKIGLAEAWLNTILTSINQAKLEELSNAAPQALAALEGVNRPDLLAEAMLRMSMTYRRFGQFDDSVTIAMQNMEIAKQSNNAMALANAYHGMALAFEMSGRNAEARDYYLKMREQAKTAHSRLLEADSMRGLGYLMEMAGELDIAYQTMRDAIAIYRLAGVPFYIAHGMFQLASMYSRHQRTGEALHLVNEVVQIHDSHDNKIGLWWALNERSSLYQKLDNPDAALRDAQRGYALAREINFPLYLSGSATRLSELYGVRHEYQRAYEFAHKAAEMTERAEKSKSWERIQQLVRRYETESKQRKINELTLSNQKQAAEIKQRRLQQAWLWTVVGSGAVIFAGSIFFLLRLRNSREKIRALNVSLEQRVQERTAELHQQASYLSTLLNTLPLMAWLKDADSRYLVVNKAAAESWGHAPEEFIGKTDLDFFPKEHADAYRADDAEIMRTRQLKVIEEQIQVPMGLLWVETCKAPIIGQGGEVLGTVGAARDITDAKHTAEARELALAEAQRLAQMRSDFLAQMSHELRTPLNGILGYAQVLRRDRNLTERQQAGLNVIQQSGEHLLTLINDILDSAKVEAGKLQPSLVEVALAKFLHTVGEIVRIKAEQKLLQFQCEIAADLPDMVRLDEKLLRQVLLNLLSNAVRFTDTGVVGMRVRYFAPARLLFEVHDSGIGIDAASQKAIFQPFEQVGDTQRRLGGTGLGLAISRRFVQLMGSDITVESEPGKGSVFRFELQVEVIDRTAVPAGERVVTGYLGERRSILVVDDVAANRKVLVDMLEPLGFKVVEAVNGRDGVDKALACQPDLIVMDLVMPVMGGVAATGELRRLPQFAAIPIIAISASASGEDEKTCIAAGMDAFLPKPVNMDKLLACLEQMLGLEWNYDDPVRARAAQENGATTEITPLEIPSLVQLRELRGIAMQGNMRDIASAAERLIATDERYRGFGEHLKSLAAGYQSKAILKFVEQCLEEKPQL